MMTDVEESTKVRLDQEIANRLQNEHPEQFNTLVRMHLSFELDLNTDTENDPAGLDKQKLKKWKGFHKKAKGCTSAKATSPEMAKAALTKANIDDLKQLIAFLEQEENISQEGIFRKTGSLTRQNELKNLLLQGNMLPLDGTGYTAHDCASVLKSFLADLPEPLLTELYYPAYCQVADSFHSKEGSQATRSDDRLLNALQLLLLLLPEENNILLRHIIELLHLTIQHEATNKMSAVNLATLFTPHLICPRKQSPEALHTTAQHMSGIVGFMIETGQRLFHIPSKLATDIRAYFVEQRRRKTMSPEHILNESTTSDSVANTVYTFVDREKTAEAHIMNSTDTALAQLYAHIQSLPESSKKKKLVSKFNRQNGYGTPLQVLMLREKNASGGTASGSGGGLKYPRSISDSIKRHIFHKSLMSRTPKQRTGSGSQTPTTFQTPSGTSYGSGGPRQRVLFQSPVSASDSPASVGSPVCIKRCSSVSSSSSSLSSMSSHSSAGNTNAGFLVRTSSSESSCSTSSTLEQKSIRGVEVSKNETLKRRSSGELGEKFPDEQRENELDASSERKRSRVDERTEKEQVGRSKSALMVRFGNVDTVSGCNLMEDNEPPPPEDDEDFVEQEDDDIGGSENEDGGEFSTDELLLDADGEQIVADDFEDCERILSDTEEDRYGASVLGETRSRYRSEPNLSTIGYHQHQCRGNLDQKLLIARNDEVPRLKGRLSDENSHIEGKSQPVTPGTSAGGSTKQRINFFKNKLIKGVSMGNLRFPFVSDGSKGSKKSNNRSVETLNRTGLKTAHDATMARDNFADYSFLPTLRSSVPIVSTGCTANNGSSDDNSNELPETQPPVQAIGWTANCLTSTPGPSTLIGGRNSMSPITKSTQRMPKSMQESIMTPRSRKPVMLLAAMNANDPQQLSTTCASFSSLKEEDEEMDLEPAAAVSTLNGGAIPSSSRFGNEVGLPSIPTHFPTKGNIDSGCVVVHGGGCGDVAEGDQVSASLTSPFRDYLLSRGLMPTESPADLSFASQSDDFESSAEILDQLSESKMSESLLYCMNGNEPKEKEVTKVPAAVQRLFERVDSELDETAL
ncbi:serine-rich adhesin for platelets isoform X1 [Anopheles funestus]|uniref:serine-rich adhesin for platelets isoform X1 n=1 Tax=Anopheles funestus TaxID=62324 RepID=UPI0020C62A8C|nr:serine-rich adhesin for platelets isoform X1 [Anopheles funestus]